jgi:hypothetical protein
MNIDLEPPSAHGADRFDTVEFDASAERRPAARSARCE